MTEAEWLAAHKPLPMIRAVRDRVSERKLRLLACASCRDIWDQFTDERCRRAVEVAERYADGAATRDELHTARMDAWRAGEEYLCTRRERPGWAQAARLVASGSAQPESVLGCARSPRVEGEDPEERRSRRRARDRALLCDIVGPLAFRPVTFEPVWRTSDVMLLAQGIYHERAFDRMPILADALQEAGCDNPDILDHCRGSRPHVRGCWVVDLVLGKE